MAPMEPIINIDIRAIFKKVMNLFDFFLELLCLEVDLEVDLPVLLFLDIFFTFVFLFYLISFFLLGFVDAFFFDLSVFFSLLPIIYPPQKNNIRKLYHISKIIKTYLEIVILEISKISKVTYIILL